MPEGEHVSNDTSLVAAADLGRITLFSMGSQDEPQSATIQVWGTIRNDLPRPVEKVQLKILIYDGAGRLIDTQTFPSVQNSRLEPGVPTIFNIVARLNNLPTVYQPSVQIIEAHYVQP